VDHVCKHGGKRMFIMGDKPEDRVKVESGEKIAAFDVALEGSDVKVIGVGQITKIDEAYLDNWEAEALAEEEEHTEGEEEGAGDDHHGGALEQIAALRKQLEDSDREYLGFYHVECVSFEELH